MMVKSKDLLNRKEGKKIMNKFDKLMELVAELINEGYKMSSYTLLDIKNEREDREITLVYDDNFNLEFKDGRIELHTTSSSRCIDDEFIRQATYLSMIKNQFNSEN